MNSIFRRILLPALEEVSDGKFNKEIEYVFYARVTDFEQLKQAKSKEEQEQWEVKVSNTEKNAGHGSIRIRRTVADGGTPEYVMTTKVKMKDGAKMEVPIPTTEDNFKQFKLLSESGMKKDRYLFPIEGSDLVWEVDMYHKPGGGYHEWCKIDLEVKALGTAIPAYPIDLTEVITAQDGERSEAEEQQVRHLYDEMFITPNEYRS